MGDPAQSQAVWNKAINHFGFSIRYFSKSSKGGYSMQLQNNAVRLSEELSKFQFERWKSPGAMDWAGFFPVMPS